MTINDVLHWIGVGSFLFYAIVSAIKPKFAARVLEQGLNSGRGVSEFRILHGGFFSGIALAVIYFNHPLAYQALGWGWIGAALTRLLAYLPDRPERNISFISFLGEFVLGIFLLV